METIIIKLFERKLIKSLKTLITDTADVQFEFRNRLSTIDQPHRVRATIKNAVKTK